MTYKSIMLLFVHTIISNFIIDSKIVSLIDLFPYNSKYICGEYHILSILYFRSFIIVYCKNKNEIGMVTKGLICCTNTNGYMIWLEFIIYKDIMYWRTAHNLYHS